MVLPKSKKKKEIGKVARIKRLSVSITVQKTIDLESDSLNIELISDLISYFIFANFLLLLLNKVEKALTSQSYTTRILSSYQKM